MAEKDFIDHNNKSKNTSNMATDDKTNMDNNVNMDISQSKDTSHNSQEDDNSVHITSGKTAKILGFNPKRYLGLTSKRSHVEPGWAWVTRGGKQHVSLVTQSANGQIRQATIKIHHKIVDELINNDIKPFIV